MTPFGRLVERFRKERGFRTDELAQLVGVSRTTMYRQLTGQSQISDQERTAYRVALKIPEEAIAQLDRALNANERREAARFVAETVATNETDLSPFSADVERMARLLDTGLQYRSITPIAVRAVLNGIEEAARLDGHALTPKFWDLRRRVHEQLAQERNSVAADAKIRLPKQN